MKPHKDPTPDLYRILDEAGLTTPTIMATREPMAKIVTGIRGEIVLRLKEYIETREKIVGKDKDDGKQ